jgi:hypothetical protein
MVWGTPSVPSFKVHGLTKREKKRVKRFYQQYRCVHIGYVLERDRGPTSWSVVAGETCVDNSRMTAAERSSSVCVVALSV